MPEYRKPSFSAKEARDIVKAQREAAIGASTTTQRLAKKYRQDPAYQAARKWVWQKRKEGLTPEHIAAISKDEFGEKITWPRVDAMIESAAGDPDPDALKQRQLEDARLDWYLECLAPQIAAGQKDAIKTAVSIGERRARMWGFDAPQKVHAHLTGDVDPTILDMVHVARDEQRAQLTGHTGEIIDAEVLDDETDAEEGYVDLDLAGDTPEEEL